MKTYTEPGQSTLNLEGNRLATRVGETSASTAVKLQTLLVPMQDEYDCSKKALQYAIPFARELDARIVLLNVMPIRCLPAYRFDAAKSQWLPESDEERTIEHKLAALAGETVPAEIPVEVRVQFGTPAAEILSAARLMDVDLIIMATHGHKGLIHMLVGSVASRVARLAPCPVLVVREKEHEFVLGKSNFNSPGRDVLTLATA